MSRNGLKFYSKTQNRHTKPFSQQEVLVWIWTGVSTYLFPVSLPRFLIAVFVSLFPCLQDEAVCWHHREAVRLILIVSNINTLLSVCPGGAFPLLQLKGLNTGDVLCCRHICDKRLHQIKIQCFGKNASKTADLIQSAENVILSF